MAATTPAGGEGANEDDGIGGDLPRSGVDYSTRGIDDGGAYSISEDCSDDDDFAEAALSTLYDDILEVRIYFDVADSEPPIYVVDQEGIVFESQSSSSSAAHGTGVCTQESKNVKGKLKVVLELEEEDGYEGSGGSDCEGEDDSDGNPFYMGDVDDIETEEGKR
ncbi:hypothetical protein D1007_36375 [Hordeum vulgare]|nr:hypothetical protein D1007_36375 [Hordeum vulgare]